MNSSSDKKAFDVTTFLQTSLPDHKDKLTPEGLWWYHFILVKNNYNALQFKDQKPVIVTGFYGEEINLSWWLAFQNIRYQHHNLTLEQSQALKDIDVLNPVTKKTNETLLITGWLNLIDTDNVLMLLPTKKEHLNRYEIWPYNYLLLKKYYQEHGNVKIKFDEKIIGFYGEDVSLFGWINSQRYRKKNETLPPRQEELLLKLGFKLPISKQEMIKKTYIKWEKAIENNNVRSILPNSLEGLSIYDMWWYKYYFLCRYYKEHENVVTRKNMIVTGFYGEKINLNNWLITQRGKYRKQTLDRVQIEKLGALGFVWNVNSKENKDSINDIWSEAIKNNNIRSVLPKEKESLNNYEKWWYSFSLLKDYYQEHHNLTMYYRQKVTGYYGEEVDIESWYSIQKKYYQESKLSQLKISALESITKDWPNYVNIKREYGDDNTKKLMQELANKWQSAIENNTVTDILPSKKESLEFLEVWWYNFYITKKFLDANKNIVLTDSKIIIGHYGEVFNIGTWFYQQKRKMYGGSLNEYQLKALKTIDLVNNKVKSNINISEKWFQAIESNSIIDILPFVKSSMSSQDIWWYNYSFIFNYYQKHGNIDISSNMTVTGYYKETINLGTWVYRLKKQIENSSLSRLQLEALKKIKFSMDAEYQKSKGERIKEKWLEAIKYNTVFDILPQTKKELLRLDIWWYNYWLAKKYYDIHGELKLNKMQCITGYYGESVDLSGWLNAQKTRYKNGSYLLSAEQIKLLENLGIEWNKATSSHDRWKLSYKEAVKYYETNGNLLIPSDYKVTLEDNTPCNLGTWIKNQRISYQSGQLSPEKIELLEKIKMVWSVYRLIWEERFAAAKAYFQSHGNLNVENDYMLDCKMGPFNLYDWLKQQRDNYWQQKLSKDQIEVLESIHIDWTKLSMDWLRMFNYAKEYYVKNGNLRITGSYKFINSNGNSVGLGTWLKYQTRCYEKGELLPLQIELLNGIGMIWNISSNRLDIIKLFEFYHIKGSQMADVIKRYSSLEVNAKIQLCIQYNMPFNDDKNLNPIFTMSSKDLQEKYNVSLEELIKKHQSKLELVR